MSSANDLHTTGAFSSPSVRASVSGILITAHNLIHRLATNLVTYVTTMIGGNPGFAAILVRRE